ncbi:MAG: response regulator transcription factor [Bacteroidetes bacterium]|nr:response regulator transcription factor [Bacteroidota bacterium]
MNKITALIVDDEKDARDMLERRLIDFPEIIVISKESNVDSAIAKIIEHNPDIIFLDIDMPGKDGFDLINEIRSLNLNPTIIFITAYNHAIEAFEQAAFDYLLKPIDPERLKKSINRYKVEKNQKKSEARFEKLQTILNQNKIRFNTRTGCMLVDTHKIIYCQASGNYTEIVLSNGLQETVSQQLGQVEKLLPPDFFFRIDRSAIINLNYLIKIDRRLKCCELYYGERNIKLKASRERLKKLEGMEI